MFRAHAESTAAACCAARTAGDATGMRAPRHPAFPRFVTRAAMRSGKRTLAACCDPATQARLELSQDKGAADGATDPFGAARAMVQCRSPRSDAGLRPAGRTFRVKKRRIPHGTTGFFPADRISQVQNG